MSDKDQVIAAGLRDGAVKLPRSGFGSDIVGEMLDMAMKKQIAATFDAWPRWGRKLVDEKGRWLAPEKIAPMGEMRIPFWSKK